VASSAPSSAGPPDRRPIRDVATVRFAEPKVLGKLDKAIVRRVLRRYLSQIRYCYERVLQIRPGAAGSATLTLQIGETGGVVDSRPKGFDKDLDGCLTTRSRTWTFPRPKQGVANVTQALIFETAQ
jgi:hypothetical protein